MRCGGERGLEDVGVEPLFVFEIYRRRIWRFGRGLEILFGRLSEMSYGSIR